MIKGHKHKTKAFKLLFNVYLLGILSYFIYRLVFFYLNRHLQQKDEVLVKNKDFSVNKSELTHNYGAKKPYECNSKQTLSFIDCYKQNVCKPQHQLTFKKAEEIGSYFDCQINIGYYFSLLLRGSGFVYIREPFSDCQLTLFF